VELGVCRFDASSERCTKKGDQTRRHCFPPLSLFHNFTTELTLETVLVAFRALWHCGTFRERRLACDLGVWPFVRRLLLVQRASERVRQAVLLH
jgi:hypothetical protein